MLRDPSRWQTPFSEWVQDVGVRGVAERAAVSPNAVYKWIAGAHSPRTDIALRLVEYSAGRVTLMDIYTQRMQLELLRIESYITAFAPAQSRP